MQTQHIQGTYEVTALTMAMADIINQFDLENAYDSSLGDDYQWVRFCI